MYQTKFKSFGLVLSLLLCLPIFSFAQGKFALLQKETPSIEWQNNLSLENAPTLPNEAAKSKATEALKNKALKKGDVFRLEQLFFAADRDEIQTASYEILDELVEALQERTEIKQLEIGGFTNGLPPTSYCDQLSEARAKKVYEYLVDKNVDASRLEYKGYGKQFPIASDKTPEGRRQNQRVEIKILDMD